MRRYVPAFAVALLAASASAQTPDSPVLVTNLPDPMTEGAAADVGAVVGLDPAVNPRLWATADYLVAYTRPQGVPLLVGTIPDAQAGNPAVNSSPLFPDRDKLRFGRQNGVRARIGGQLTDRLGADFGGFVLESASDGASFASPGSPSLVRTYARALDGVFTNLYSALPGRYSGQVSVVADTQAWGLDANARVRGYTLFASANDVLFGVRYVNLAESLVIHDRSDLEGGVVNTVLDAFRTSNHLYVGQVGLHSRTFMGRFTLDLTEKFGMGGADQRIEIFGRNTLTGEPDQNTGLYTQPGINGIHQRGRFVATNEFGIALGFNPVPRVGFRVGYNILWMSSVVRPGPAIDRVINDSSIRFVADPPADPNSPRPTFSFDRATTDMWIQSLTLGVSVGF